jgi:hypothetical protein
MFKKVLITNRTFVIASEARQSRLCCRHWIAASLRSSQ